jgi:hypothetical protein
MRICGRAGTASPGGCLACRPGAGCQPSVPGLPDDVDPAHPLAAFTSDQPYMLPDSPDAARLRELTDQEITQLLRRATDDPDMDMPGLLTAARTGTSG